MSKKIFLLSAALLVVFCLCFFTGCNSGGAGSGNGGDAQETSLVADSVDRKIVYDVRMEMESKKIEHVRDSVLAECKLLGGYVAEQYEQSDGEKYTRVHLVLKIPTENLDAFVDSADENGKMTYKRVSAIDITTEYVKAQSKKNALTGRKTLLEQLLNDSSVTSAEKINIINEISKVDAEIQAIELEINGYDSMADYSTVTLTIDKPASIVPVAVALTVLFVLIIGAVVFIVIKKKKADKWKNSSYYTDNGGGENLS